MLAVNQDIMYVIRVRVTPGDLVIENLKHMLYPRRIINVNVCDEIITLREKRKLQIAIFIQGLKAACVSIAFWRRVKRS